MALTGTFSTVRAQTPAGAGFATAFAYVEELLRPDSAAAQRLRAIPAGEARRVELGGGVFAMEQAYLTKPRTEGFFESHRQHIDVQVVVEGEETMELADAARIAAKGAFAEEKDLQLYGDFAGATQLRVRAGDAAVFFPADVHMPSLQVAGGGPGLVRKTVVKVPVA